MNAATRRTRACSLEALDRELQAAIRAHGTEFGLDDIESDILMCCETISVHQKKGFAGGLRTTLSAVYVTPKWLVWAESGGRDDVAAGTVQLTQIDVRDDQAAQYTLTPDQGLSITGQYTDKTKTGIPFIVLEAGVDGQKFRQILDEALRSVAK